jgi:hypothetical protein
VALTLLSSKETRKEIKQGSEEMEEDILNKTINRARGTSGIPPGNIRKMYEPVTGIKTSSPGAGLNAMEPISVDAMEPISVDAMEPISVDAMEPISVDAMKPTSVDPMDPLNLKPGRIKWNEDTDPGGFNQGTTINIGPITINASSEGEGRAAARAFKEEMARRGVQFSR